MAAYRNQRIQIEHLEAFINRFRYQATKAKQVQSRIKELEKIERIEVPEEEPVIHFRFPQPPPSGRMVAEAEGALQKLWLQAGLEQRALIPSSAATAWLWLAVNGAGKSTLIKLLTARKPLQPAPSNSAITSWRSTSRKTSTKSSTATSACSTTISRAAVKVPEQALRSLLGCFLFSGDDVFKPLGVLSGGERNRFALARILVSPSNFLLLDEPTNHLDMRAKDVLLEALAAFSGTVIFVSHDRYFIDRLATRVLEVENGSIATYEGDYEDYPPPQGSLGCRRASDPKRRGRSANRRSSRASPRQRASRRTCVFTARRGRGCRFGTPPPAASIPSSRNKWQERCAFLEEEIPRVEAAIAHTEEQSGVYISTAETQRLTDLAASLRDQLAALTAEWEDLMLQLEGA